MESSLQNYALSRVAETRWGGTRRPPMFVRFASHVGLAAIFGEVNWTRNLRATGEAILTPGRSRTAVVAVGLPPEAGAEVLRDAVAPDASSRLVAWFARRYVEVTPDAQLSELPRLGSIRCSSCAIPHASSATAAATPSTTGGSTELHIHASR